MDKNIIISLLLWSIFGYQHSLLARPKFKNYIKSILGTTFEKHCYPLIYFISQCIIFLIIYDLIRQLDPGSVIIRVDTEYEIVIYTLNRFANIFLILTIFHFDVGRFTGVTQFLGYFKKERSKDANYVEELNTNYLYRYIRHPMYLGIIFVYATSTTIYSEIFFVNLVSIIFYIEIGSYFEEKTLIAKYGLIYKEYSKGTYKYLPFIR